MTSDVIQAKYELLEQIAARFAQEAEAGAGMGSRVRQAMAGLQQSGWIGAGADAFFEEMDGRILPAHDRLIHALQESQKVTRQIIAIIQQAEEEAAAPFGGNGSGGTGGPGAGSFPPGLFPPGFTPIPGQPGQPGSPPTIRPIPQPPGGGSSIWDHFRSKGDIWSFDSSKGPDGSRKGGKFAPGIKATFGTEESSVWGSPKGDSLAAVGGYGEAGIRANLDDGVMIGAGGEFYTVKGEWDTAFVGDKEYGVTGGVGFKGLSAEGFAGFQFDKKDQAFGAKVGVNAVSVEGSVGGNVAGVNVSLAGEIGLKAEFGFKIGKKTEIALPFITIGFKFGGGVD